jgi:hypothetical protein
MDPWMMMERVCQDLDLVNLGSFVDLGESYGILVRKLQGCTPYL